MAATSCTFNGGNGEELFVRALRLRCRQLLSGFKQGDLREELSGPGG